MRITLEDLFNIPTAVIYNPDAYKSAAAVFIDSRQVKKKSIFVAIKGKNFDGHDFVKEAVKKGAGAIIINKRKLSEFDELDLPVITVSNTTHAYGELARIWRKKLKAKVISITGSNGKTSTKEILSEILSEKYKVHKTTANNNNHIGVPLTILSAPSGCEVVVLEHGTNHFGEIEYTAKIAQPDYSLITNIGSGHLEFLKDKKGVYKEKSALLEKIGENEPVRLINNDDLLIRKNSKNYPNRITFGFRTGSDVKADITGYSVEGQIRLSLKYKSKKVECILPLYGRSSASNVVSSAAAAFVLGLNESEIRKGISKLKQIKGRLFVKRYGKTVLIDDTYNSNPESLASAVDTLKKIKLYKRKILVLGDMFELGKGSGKHHVDAANKIAGLPGGMVFSIGKYMRQMHQRLIESGYDCKHFSSRTGLKNKLNELDLDKSVILVKGSRGMHMEEFLYLIEQKLISENNRGS